MRKVEQIEREKNEAVFLLVLISLIFAFWREFQTHIILTPRKVRKI